MISRIEIENFKSIQKLSLDLGRITVLIGENGAGKSNILEAIAFGSAAAALKLEHEFMATRGIRMTEPKFMRPAFPGAAEGDICIRFAPADAQSHEPMEFEIRSEKEGSAPPAWSIQSTLDWRALGWSKPHKRMTKKLRDELPSQVERYIANRKKIADQLGLAHFLIFSPENTPLRTFEDEGQILPLGINGSGLFSHLKYLARAPEHAEKLEEIIEKLSLIDWFEKFEIPKDLFAGERILHLRDRYLAEGALFDQRSANEGFLFLLFYFTLFISPSTPSFFAIDNIDASLNPKLCRALVKELVALAKKHNKQAILTTHNPAVLDGINLHDDEQRLFVVSRDDETGETQVSRIHPPKPLDGRPPVMLSEAFMRGYIGGLPKNF